MKTRLIVFSVFVLICLSPPSVQTQTPTTWTVDDDGADFPTALFTHPQDAVNAAAPGDTIKVYPGIYGTRQAPAGPPYWTFSSDFTAPPLIVYKDGLTIEAVDPDPAKTVIESTYYYPSNPVAIQWSTGGKWSAAENKYIGAGVNPVFGTAPNAIAVIASNVVIRGFTLRCPTPIEYSSGVMIGGLYAGYGGAGEVLGFGNNIVENCVFEEGWDAVYIWHSSGNSIVHNTVAALMSEDWAGISINDGSDDAQIALGFPSKNNLISNNKLANRGIAVGAWAPWIWTSNAGTIVCCNKATMVGVTYSNGPVLAGGNVSSSDAAVAPHFWPYNAQDAMEIHGVTYTGDTEISGAGPENVNLSASLDFEGTGGNNVQVVFNVGGTDYAALTTLGNASTTANLAPGTYAITTKVELSDCCSFTDIDSLTIRQSAMTVGVDIKPGGFPNSVKLKDKGVLPVAILGSSDLDVTQIVFGTLKIGSVAPLSRNRYGLEDVNSDGFVDMVVHFSMAELTGFHEIIAETTQLTIIGALMGGTSITGTDSVRIIQ